MSLPQPIPDLNAHCDTGRRFALLDKLEALAEETRTLITRRRSNRFALLAAKAWRDGRIEASGRAAMRAVTHDDTNVTALQLLGRYLERLGHIHKAVVTYERAFKLDPTDPVTMLYLGIAAYVTKEFEGAARMFRLYIANCPDSPDGYNNLASALSDLGKAGEAIDVLNNAIQRMPEEGSLWSTLGMVLTDAGRVDESLVFFNEAIRLAPDCGRFYHNLGYALLNAGRFVEGIDLYDKALEFGIDPGDALEMTHSRGVCLIGLGRLAEGFAAYEIRGDVRFRNHVHQFTGAPRWNGETVTGKKVLIMAEQGLGDEIMFANILPDVVRAVGPDGKLEIAVDSRLVELFQRSFPQAVVGFHEDRSWVDEHGKKEMRWAPFAEKDGKPDYWALMGSPLCWLRKSVEDFPHEAFLIPDPERVEEFRKRLAAGGPGLKVGICWRSMLLSSNRGRFYSPFDLWGPILKTPGVRFVNVQYGDCAAEIARAEDLHGVKIEVMDGLDLKDDIDGAAALSAALDLVISAPTASAALAAAVGAETWFVTASRSWPQLGTDAFPWYRKTKVFYPEKVGDWQSLMPKISDELKALA